MPRIQGVLETALYVDDLPRATDFYQTVMGLPLIDGSARLSVFDVNGRSVLLLFKRGATRTAFPTEGGTIPGHDGSGPAHFAFAVRGSDLDEWERWLTAHGVPIESKVAWNLGGRSVFFRDPDDHLVELATPGTWETY